MTTYVPAVTVYGDFSSRTLSIREAVDFNAAHNVTVMLGAMRGGGLGREMVTADDLHHWIAEDDDAAMWQAVSDGERAASEMSLLR